jgi:acyl-CoA reductase-like NAD-dependent aldehyde dehydrogenase
VSIRGRRACTRSRSPLFGLYPKNCIEFSKNSYGRYAILSAKIRKYGLFINGQETDSVSGKTYIRENPATEEPFAEMRGSEGRRRQRGKSGGRAFETWSRSRSRAGKLIHRIAELMTKIRKRSPRQYARTGKPIGEPSRGDRGAVKTSNTIRGRPRAERREHIGIGKPAHGRSRSRRRRGR